MKSLTFPLAIALFAACQLPAAEFRKVTCEGVYPRHLHLQGRYEFDCSLGIVGLPDGRFLSADGRSEKDKGCTGSVKLAIPDDKSGFKFVVED